MKISAKWVKRVGLMLGVCTIAVVGTYRHLSENYAAVPVSAEEFADTDYAPPTNPFYQDYSMLDNQKAAIYWNEWGNLYSHYLPTHNIFLCYSHAIELNPHEAIYYRNLGTSLFVFRKDAREFFAMNEQQVFDTAMRNYEKAQLLDPNNYELAHFVAESYYSIQPLRLDKAMSSWSKVLTLAPDELSRQEVYLHFARLEVMAGHTAEAKAYLNKVTAEPLSEMRSTLERRIEEKRQPVFDKFLIET